MKGQDHIGEIDALTKCRLPIEVKRFGRPGFVQSRACEPLDIYLADCGLNFFRDMWSLPDYGMIILDEVLVAIDAPIIEHINFLRENCRVI